MSPPSVELVVSEDDDGERLDRLLAARTGIPRSRLRIAALEVDGRPVRPKDRVGAGSRITAECTDAAAARPAPSAVEVPVLVETPDWVVVDKPVGMAVHPPKGDPGRPDTLVNALLGRYPEIGALGDGDAAERPGIVHRIDRDTSGLLVVARTARGLDELRVLVADRAMHREYAVLVTGRFDAPAGEVDAPIGRRPGHRRLEVMSGGRHARTGYRVAGGWPRPDVSALAVVLHTGRTHQIRVHMASIGHPVVGDRLYGGRMLSGVSRQFLHAHRLTFEDPLGSGRVDVVSQLPDDLQALLDRLGPPSDGSVPGSWTGGSGAVVTAD